jgi:Protein of unknown function DUF72
MFIWAGLTFRSSAHDHSEERNAFTPDTIPWGPAPPVVRHGAQFAVLEGDPASSTGDFTIRLKMPDGFRISPHFHPERENVTVISGTFKVGMGDDFEAHKMKALTAGTFRFSLKVPRAITHDAKLKCAPEQLTDFLQQVRYLDGKLGPLLVQTPPSLEFEIGLVSEFFALLRQHHSGDVACEPRHSSWFLERADQCLQKFSGGPGRLGPCVRSGGRGYGWLANCRVFSTSRIAAAVLLSLSGRVCKTACQEVGKSRNDTSSLVCV